MFLFLSFFFFFFLNLLYWISCLWCWKQYGAEGKVTQSVSITFSENNNQTQCRRHMNHHSNLKVPLLQSSLTNQCSEISSRKRGYNFLLVASHPTSSIQGQGSTIWGKSIKIYCSNVAIIVCRWNPLLGRCPNTGFFFWGCFLDSSEMPVCNQDLGWHLPLFPGR